MVRFIFLWLCFAAFASLHAAEADLPHVLDIVWHRGPDLPQAFQDSDGGIVDGVLVTTCGYSDSGQTIPKGKESKSPVGHHRKTWGLMLDDPKAQWQVLPDYPGEPRQELCGVVVGSALFTWGGFSYAPPFVYRDGYRLTRRNDQWQWDRLPDLPWAMCSMSCCAIRDSIYLFGGADYRLPENKFLTAADHSGKIPRIGARLLTIKATSPKEKFKELAQCPGTPRFVAAMAAVKGKLYVIGGASGQDNPTNVYCTVVDNWQYDPAADKWSRLPDTPIATGNFPAGAIVYDQRYVLLIGGYQYRNVMNSDATTRPAFGLIFRHYPDKDYCSDVLVFDTETNSFGRATSLPLNNNMPMAVMRGDELHLIGGETGGSVIGGEAYAHHPDLYLVGKISKVAASRE